MRILTFPRSRPRRAARAAVIALASVALALVPMRAAAAGDDPALPMLRRIDRYLQEHRVDGVTMDWRYQVIPSEEIRQTVVCQLLAYVELARLDPRPRLGLEIERHADFLLPRLAEVRSYTPFDGMLAYALLGAYERTGAARFRDAAYGMTADLLAIPTGECVLNGGLMVAMATAEYARQTGDADAARKTRDIVAGLAPFQNPDGSFPHWCPGSRDIHYTGWMAMELVHIGRAQPHSSIEPCLARMSEFLAARIGPGGRARYEEPCPGEPGCTLYYYSRASGCPQDLDSRGWTVEPAYCGLLFDRTGAAPYGAVMAFLDSLEDGGTLPDLFGYWPPPSDPEYPWTIADTSVVCMSIDLWVLATLAAQRVERGESTGLVLDDVPDTSVVPPPPPPPALLARALAAAPNPAPGGCVLRFALVRSEAGSLVVADAAGRRVRTLRTGTFARGEHAIGWDGRDDAGRACRPGVYVARLALSDRAQVVRLALVR